jgi:hypothetical protein
MEAWGYWYSEEMMEPDKINIDVLSIKFKKADGKKTIRF